MKSELLILIPTYNEKENVEKILSQIFALSLSADILFIDDNSPDGTGQLLEEMAKKNKSIFVLNRPGKKGIGSAHADGINWAYDSGYRTLITMDCDLSHSPEYISEFILNSTKADIVVGSRYLQEKSLSTWNIFRKTLTHLGHFSTKIFLNMPYDATGAFRLYRLDRISRHFINCVSSNNYPFFFESLYVLHANKYNIVEVPINLPARVYGHSKMQLNNTFESISRLFFIKLISIFDPERYEITDPIQPELLGEAPVDPQDWDSYWSKNENKSKSYIYDLIAAFYRKFIIRPALNYFILRNFNSKSKLLHAGCGSGQVDLEIGKNIRISALDISPNALNIYKKSNKNYHKIILGSIFNIPEDENSYDGIYNLGVMEHFSENEIIDILKEFNRVLIPNGKIVLFWPPEYGLSVLFLKVIHFFINIIMRKNIQLHPPEITRIKSRQQAKIFLNKAGFKLSGYSFGFRDLFTHVVVVGEKN